MTVPVKLYVIGAGLVELRPAMESRWMFAAVDSERNLHCFFGGGLL